MRAITIRSALFASAATLLVAAPAYAQEAPPTTDTATTAAVNDAQTRDEAAAAPDGDIVVTARRRTETLIDVPIAVTAYSGEQLDRQGAIDISDIGDTTPNVTLETSRGTNSTLTAFIRGVGQQDPVAGYEGGVGIYLDDVYLNRPQGALLDVYDVERIEVLRGPQGTLYGRNTIGGAIKYVTRSLSANPEGKVRAAVGSYGQRDLVISGSVPLADFMRIGGAVARLTRNGFGTNLTTGAENYDKDIFAVRGTTELLPTDAIRIKIAGDYTWDSSSPRGGHRFIPSLLSRQPVLGNVFDTRGGLVNPKQDVRGGGISIRGDFEVSDGITLRSITAWRKDKSVTPIDFDALAAADVDVPAIYRNRQFSQEVQLLVESGRLNGLIGGYYLNANANNIFDVLLGTTGAALGLPGFTASTFGDVDTKTYAGFADFTYDLTDQFSISLGGRYTSDKRNATVIRKNLIGGVSPALGGAGVQLGALTSNFVGEKTFKQFTPRASVSFQPNSDTNIYASWSKGFKGGGFDPRGLSTAAPDLNGNGTREPSEIFDYFLFEPEKVTSYEIGYKAALFDRRVRVAIAGFIADYKDAQVPGSAGAVINGVPTFVGVTTNAGKAQFKGIEFEGSAIIARDFAGPGSRFNVSGSVGYLDAKYKQFITNIAAFDASGNPAPTSRAQPIDVANFREIQNTPKWTNSASVDFSIPAGPGMLGANATASYRSKSTQFELPSPYLDQKGYSLFDANLTYDIGQVRIGLHGKNLFDKRYITSGYQFLTVNPVTGQPILSASPASPVFAVPGVAPSLGLEGVVTGFYGAPRQVFVSLDIKF
ncbi:TonB-dependent receptor [Sphingomonas kaistensis]|uniref:TonB-dependent receptor n=1 Tax=Sphingomonas kaistensis TaxID=298708 RepID=A0ABZ2G133_9SPHN